MGFFDIGGGSEQKNVTQPWGPQQPFIKKGWSEAERLYDQGGPQYYDRATYTPFSPQTEMAMGLTQGRALAGSPLNQAGQSAILNQLSQGPMSRDVGVGQLNTTAAGGYLGSNPYLQSIVGNMARDMGQSFNENIMPGINATFGGAGRSNSGIHALSAGRAAGDASQAVSDAAARLYGDSYESERRLMQDASGQLMRGYSQDQADINRAAYMTPYLAAQDYSDFDRLAGVGQQVEGKANQILQGDMDRWNFNQQRPEQNLDRFIGRTGTPVGQFSKTSTPSNIIEGIANVGALGSTVAGIFTGNPALVAAGAGGLKG